MKNLIKIKDHESIKFVNEINYFRAPEKIYVPTKCLKETFKINDYVFKNTIFDNYVSSVSGKIINVDEILYNNSKSEVLVVENDYKENINNKNKKVKIKSKEDLIEVIKKYNLENIYKKITEIKDISHFVVKSIDEEVYSIKQLILLQNYYHEILETINLIQSVLKLKQSLLVTKNTNFNSIKNVKSIIGTYPNIMIRLVEDKYLIGEDVFLCKHLNYNLQKTLILTVEEILEIHNIIFGHSMVETIITVSGNKIKSPLIMSVRIGTSLKEIMSKYLSDLGTDYDIFINGLLKGYRIKDGEDILISKEIHSIVINKIERKSITNCINCGACKKICPVNINVKLCYEKKLKHKKCLGCGLCNYICPANLKLKEIVSGDKL